MGMIDPPRPEIPPAIITAKKAGLRTIMITGDYPNTASAIASEVGLLHNDSSVVTGAQIDNLLMKSYRKK
jgi:Ca2+-transporting ATPase